MVSQGETSDVTVCQALAASLSYPPPRPAPPPPPHPLVAEGAFWWGEAYTVALPRLKALPSSLQRLRALAMAVGRPPYSMIRCETRGHNHNHNHN